MRPMHALLLALPLCAYLFYRGEALEARVRSLERAAAGTGEGSAATGSRATAQPGPEAAFAGPDPVALAELRQELATLRAEIKSLRAPDAAEEAKDQILDVVEQERQRLLNVQVDFHRERWHEAREDALKVLADQAQLTDFQQARVEESLTREVDRLAELARTPGALEDPETLANDVIQQLDETNERVGSVLNREQRAIWDQHRQRERLQVFPWLPR